MSSPPPEPRAFCYRCFKPAALCICDRLERVDNRIHVHIIQHPREQRCAIGTARFAHLGLARCVVEANAPATGVPSSLASSPPLGAALLFPSEDAQPVETLSREDRPSALIVLDGTWGQAAALYRNNPWLEALPHLRLAEPEPTRYRIRSEPKRHCISTIEAIVSALRVLEPETQGIGALLDAFDAMIDDQVEYASARQSPRAQTRARIQRDPVPALLREHPERHVVVHVEAIGTRPPMRPIQICAQRLVTGERFECLVTPDDQAAVDKASHLGWGPNALKRAVGDETLRRRWARFRRDDDVLMAWSQRTVQLKAEYCNLTHSRVGGGLADVVERHRLRPEETPFDGRAGLEMGQAIAIVAYLRSRPARAV